MVTIKSPLKVMPSITRAVSSETLAAVEGAWSRAIHAETNLKPSGYRFEWCALERAQHEGRIPSQKLGQCSHYQLLHTLRGIIAIRSCFRTVKPSILPIEKGMVEAQPLTVKSTPTGSRTQTLNKGKIRPISEAQGSTPRSAQ